MEGRRSAVLFPVDRFSHKDMAFAHSDKLPPLIDSGVSVLERSGAQKGGTDQCMGGIETQI